MTWTLVQDQAGLAAVSAALRDAAAIAVDTEFMRRNTYYPKIALLQLCVDDRAWLVDPLRVDDLEELRALLTAGDGLRLLHSCSEDLEVFRHWLQVVPTPLVDTQRAAALLGEDFGLGYRSLVQRLLGIELEKGETRSDWLRRPLTDAQCHYAAQDVIQLLPAWAQLQERAAERGRMAWILEESQEVVRAQEEREAELYRRVKGASRLNRRQLAVLRKLCQWREARARAVDKPRGWILEDKACLAIAQMSPARLEQLRTVDNIPPAVLRRQGQALLDCVAAGREESEESLPPAFPRPLNSEQRARLKQLRSAAGAVAADLGVAPEILMGSADLELLIRQADGEPVSPPGRWEGWRRDAVIDPLRNTLGAA